MHCKIIFELLRISCVAVGDLSGINYPNSPDATLQYDALIDHTSIADGVGASLFTHTTAGHMLIEDGPWTCDTAAYIYTQRRRTALSINAQLPPLTPTYGWDSMGRLTSVTSPAAVLASAALVTVNLRSAASGVAQAWISQALLLPALVLANCPRVLRLCGISLSPAWAGLACGAFLPYYRRGLIGFYFRIGLTSILLPLGLIALGSLLGLSKRNCEKES
jgi:hypothetical protein